MADRIPPTGVGGSFKSILKTRSLYLFLIPGPPIPGFFTQVGDIYFLSNRRNEVRVPDYARLDVRVSKAFLFKCWKLTATGEKLNLLNRNNVRYAGFDGFDFSTGRVFGQLDRVLPILPSAGVVTEF